MRIKVTALLTAGLLLSGCAEFGAKLVTNANADYDYFRGAAANYVKETVDDRVWVRAQCRMGLMMQVSDLQQEGKWEEANALLRSRYTPLITETMWDNRETDESLLSHLQLPHICGTDS
jgi:hypothetical protein